MERVSRLAQSQFLEGESYVWRVWEPDGQLVGSVDLHSINRAVPSCEIGFWLRSDRTGRGLAQEFATAAIEIAHKTLKVERIEVSCAAARYMRSYAARRSKRMQYSRTQQSFERTLWEQNDIFRARFRCHKETYRGLSMP